MIPISLNIKGLYSYQQEQSIDFTKLTEAQLFGIFGTVGSGKSSILEAISFALYGQTERLGQKENRNYNMMNLKSQEMLIDFTFLNHDGITYRFTVHGKRNSKNFDNVPSFSRAAYKKTHTWEPLSETDAASIIGLNYDNFRRTIIIPQGKFQEFLQLNNAERTTMLKEIFNLDKYEFSEQAKSLNTKNEHEISRLQGRLTELGEITEEALLEKAEVVEKLEKQLEIFKTELNKLEKAEKESENLKKQFEEREQKIEALQMLEAKKEEMSALTLSVRQYEHARLNFQDLFAREKTWIDSHLKKQQDLAKIVTRLNQTQEDLKRDLAQFEQISKEFNQLELRQKEKNDFDTLIEMQQVQRALEKKSKLVTKIKEELVKLESDKRAFEKQLNEQKLSIETLKNNLSQFTAWGDVQSWFVAHEGLEEKYQEQIQKLDILNQNFKKKIDQLPKLIPDFLKNKVSISSTNAKDEFIRNLSKLAQEIEDKKQVVQEQLEALQVRSQLAAFTAQIQDGSACPLCGSHEHPEVLHIESVSQEIETKKDLKRDLETESKAIQDSIKKLELAGLDLQHIEKQKNEALEKILDLKNKIENHLKLFIWNQFSPRDKAQFTQALKENQLQQSRLRDLEKSFHDIEKQWEQAKNRFELGKEHLTSNETDIKLLENDLSRLKKQLQVLGKSELVLDVATMQEKRVALTQHIASIIKTYNALSSKIKENEIALGTLNGEKKGLENTLLELENEHKSLQNQISQKMVNSPFDSREMIEKVLSLNLNIEKEKEQISNFEKALFSAEESVKQLNELLKDSQFDLEAFQTLQQEFASKKAEKEAINKHLIAAQTILENLKKQWESKKSIKAEYTKLEIRKEQLKTMMNLFKSSGFVNYISSVYLENLCEAANHRFHKLTRQQLRLEVAENNSFQVRDFLNEGRVRSVKTLSGGQTFQASLCLALALAESIPQQSMARQNFFFLDEGFGSLDKESLRIVFDSLKALRQENRIVGVISHVEELQQEIDNFLVITNDAEKGSLVKGSWE